MIVVELFDPVLFISPPSRRQFPKDQLFKNIRIFFENAHFNKTQKYE